MVGLNNSVPFQSAMHFFWKGTNSLNPSEREEVLAYLEKMLGTLKYGSITLVIQDGKIVLIERNEKIRLQSNK